MGLAPGTRLGRYQVVALLGAGGMGEVYRARDCRLDREVAVKVLPDTLAADPDRLARFEREARTLARIEHPNILAIHDIGEEVLSDGRVVHFAVTELLTGDTLGGRLTHESLSWRRAVEIGADLADGLAAAHAQSIVHRDLKPDNVFVSGDGRVKILDFGLATSGLVTTSSAETHAPAVVTKPGTALGTVGYMAPEQILGGVVDARADLFALGCVLYEMVTGHRAFARQTPGEALSAILSAPSPELRADGSHGPAELARIIGRCLEKQSAARFQSASDLAFALRALMTTPLPAMANAPGVTASRRAAPLRSSRRLAWTAAGAATLVVLLAFAAYWAWPRETGSPSRGTALDPRKLVVAVFVNQTGDTSLDALGIQISDWLTQSLTRMSIAVAMNPEVPSVGGPALPRAVLASQGDPLRALAARTGAGLVVAGTYFLEGDTLRVQSRIVDAASGAFTPLDPATGPRSKSADLIAGLANVVTGAVALRLNSSKAFGTGYRPPPYDAYLEWIQGMSAWGTNNAEAQRRLRAVIAIDPNFSLARVNLVALLVGAGLAAEADSILRPAEEPAAFSAATPLERAWIRLGRAMIGGNLAAAETAANDIVTLAPSPLTLYTVANLQRALHRPRGAQTILERILIEDSPASAGPGVTWFLRDRAAIHHELGEYREELADAALGEQHYPADGAFFVEEIAALIGLGRVADIDAVLARCEKATLRSGSVGGTMYTAARELAAHGHVDAAQRMTARAAAWYKNRLEAGTPSPGFRGTYASLLIAAGDCAEGVAIRRSLLREAPRSVSNQGNYATALLACGGSRDEAKAIADALAKWGEPYARGAHLYERARVLAALGDAEGAVSALLTANSQGWIWNSSGLHLDSCWDPIRTHPTFIDAIEPKG